MIIVRAHENEMPMNASMYSQFLWNIIMIIIIIVKHSNIELTLIPHHPHEGETWKNLWTVLFSVLSESVCKWN